MSARTFPELVTQLAPGARSHGVLLCTDPLVDAVLFFDTCPCCGLSNGRRALAFTRHEVEDGKWSGHYLRRLSQFIATRPESEAK